MTNIHDAKINYEILPELSKKMCSIFSYNEDIEKTAYLNWRVQFSSTRRKQFVVFGEAYLDTAYCMLQECLKDNCDKKADAWIFPILFNIVHGIEIYLKAINVSFNVMLSKPKVKIEGNHDIKQLCSITRSLIIEAKEKNKGTTSDQLFTAIKIVENFINNIYQKTNDMTFARYPLDKDKNGHFYVQCLINETIDMEMLNIQIPIVFKMLEFIFEMPEDFIDRTQMVDYY